MFPRRERLSRAAFSTPNTSIQRISSTHFTAVALKEEKGWAVVVSKKVARLSVTRHRVKRRILAALRALEPQSSVIIYPRASAITLDFATTKTELASLLSKIKK